MYTDFASLIKQETEGVDFQRVIQDRGSEIVFIAPHAGGIEPGTGKVAEAAAKGTYSYYIFEGLKFKDNHQLHIPSTAFDDPACLALLGSAEVAVSIHGCDHHEEVVFLGGLHTAYKDRLFRGLQSKRFPVNHADTHHAGTHPNNICNRGGTGKGVQIEISSALRKTFFQGMDRPGREFPTRRFHQFTSAVREAFSSPTALT